MSLSSGEPSERIPRSIEERRRSIRVAEALPFKIGHHGYEIEASTVNIGIHGAMCVVDKDIPMMTQLNICLSLPGLLHGPAKPKRIRLKGVIVRKEKDLRDGRFYVAIFFSECKPADQKSLERFIQSRMAASR